MRTDSGLELKEQELTVNANDIDESALKSKIQGRLRYYYSRRLFVQEVEYDPDRDFLSAVVGITYPQDVSNSRSDENVLKMVNIGDVKTLNATPLNEGYYRFDLPNRADLYADYQEQHENLLKDLDWSMAKAIYSRVYQLNPVRNQLNSIVQIVDWVRREEELTVQDIEDSQSNENTRDYIKALESLGYVRLDESEVHHGRKIDSADLQGLSAEKFKDKVIGNIIDDGYYMLRQEMGLRMLNHFPIFANSYYISAFRRGEYKLWLTVEDILENLKVEYNRSDGRLAVQDKLQDLAKVGVLRYENGEVRGHSDIYDAVQADAIHFG